jgi:cysteine-rich repeat protein
MSKHTLCKAPTNPLIARVALALLALALFALTTSRAAVAACGGGAPNGTCNGSEECDDGNATNGDGCSSTCLIETGFSCDCPGGGGGPSTCPAHTPTRTQTRTATQTGTPTRTPTNTPPDSDADRHADRDPDQYADGNAHQHSDSHPDPHADEHRDGDDDADSDADAHADGDADQDADRSSPRHRRGNTGSTPPGRGWERGRLARGLRKPYGSSSSSCKRGRMARISKIILGNCGRAVPRSQNLGKSV